MTAALVAGLLAGYGVAVPVGAVAGAFAASASWQLVLAGGGALVGRVLTGRRGRLVTALASGVLIAGIAVFIVWS